MMYGDYVHIDRSDEFSRWGQYLTALAWIVCFFVIAVAPKSTKGWLALSGGLALIVGSRILAAFGMGVPFGSDSRFPIEPAIFIFGMMVLRACLKEYFVGILAPLFRQSRTNEESQVVVGVCLLWSHFWKSFVLGAIVMPDIAMDVLWNAPGTTEDDSTGVTGDLVQECVLRAGASLGAALTATGSVHAVVILFSLAYDNVTWMEYFINMFAPVATVCFMYLPVLFSLGLRGYLSSPRRADPMDNRVSHADYKGVPRFDLELSEEKGLNHSEMEDLEREDTTTSEGVLPSTTEPFDGMKRTAQTRAPLDTRHDSSHHRYCLAVILTALIAYGVGVDILLVCMVMVLSVFWIGRYRNPRAGYTNSSSLDHILSRLEYETLFLFIGLGIMTQTLTRAGQVQHLWFELCQNYYWNSENVTWPALTNFTFGVLLSPIPTVFIIAGSMPYASPYVWLQASFHLSMAQFARSVVRPIYQKFGVARGTAYSIPVLLSAATALVFASKVLSNIHFSPECSIRLGECDE